jgi:hypothetical protein
MRRVHCRNCGIVVEEVPWGDAKHQLTRAYMLFLARWACKLSWKETAEAFHTSWDLVCDAVEYVVGWGLEHRTLEPNPGPLPRRRQDEQSLGRGPRHRITQDGPGGQV